MFNKTKMSKKLNEVFMKKIACLSLCLLMSSASATIIDFEDLAVVVGGNAIGPNQVSNNFLFTSTTSHTHLMNTVGGANSGSTFLTVDHSAGVNQLTMSNFGNNAPFSLSSFDLGEVGVSHATSIKVVGNLVGGGSLMEILFLDGQLSVGGSISFETFTLTGWDNLESVNFLAIDGPGLVGDWFWGLDNINTAPAAVPEPVTAALLGLGLIGMRFSRKRA